MTRPHRHVVLNNIPIMALLAVLAAFVSLLSRGYTVFPNSWFPSQSAASAFMILFIVWVLCELGNNIWSRMNSIRTNLDRGSFRVVIMVSWAAIFAVFVFRSFLIGIFDGSFQYIGFVLFAAGILLREWAIYVLGKHFTVRVQVREKARLITHGPYSRIRHPSYTGTLLTVMGIAIAVGTWFGCSLPYL